MKEKVNCRNCKHFYITWDPQAPNGCRAFGFKGRLLPSIAVKNESGSDCMKFTPKTTKSKGLDLNDDKLW